LHFLFFIVKIRKKEETQTNTRVKLKKRIYRQIAKSVGIDLGTTNSVVATIEATQPTVIVNEEGYRTTTSVVAYTKTGRLLVGQIGKRQNMLNPENTFYSVKRFIGSKMTDLDEEFTKNALQSHG